MPVCIQAYCPRTPVTRFHSRLIFLSSSLLLTGRLLNRFSTVTVVPFCAATTDVPFSLPDTSNSSFVPFGALSGMHVMTVKFDRAQREDKASPRKPKVCRVVRSLYVDNFEV